MATLLYSTGLDSELYRLLENPNQLLFFKSGARYEKYEYEQLQKLQKMGLLKNHNVIVDDTLSFSSIEQADSVVPMRNIHYLLRGFSYDNFLMIGVGLFDFYYDQMENVHNALVAFMESYYYNRETPEAWRNPNPQIYVPYRFNTKAEMLKMAIDKGCNVEHIPHIRTCYSGTSEKGCGKCPACMGKAVMLASNGMFDPNLFDEDPRKFANEWGESKIELLKDDRTRLSVFELELQKLLGA